VDSDDRGLAIRGTAVQRIEDQLLGKLAVREGVCTSEQIDECLRLQAMSREVPPLGDLLLFKGYLTAPQLRGLLSRQHKKVMNCSSCRLTFTVLTLSEGRSARCPKCKEPLREANPDGPTRTDAEFSTQRVRITAPPAGPKIRIACIICDHPFEEAPDSTGRVRCPSCQSTFNAINGR